MTPITVLDKNNTPTGPFTRAQIAEKLQSGEISQDSLAFIEGLSQWTPLREVLAKLDATPLSAPLTVPLATAPAYSYAATMQPPGHMVYAGFWLRFVAYLIDGLIIFIPVFIVVMILCFMLGGFAALSGGLAHSSQGSNPSQAVGAVMGLGIVMIELVVWVGVIVITWLYFAKLESGPKQGTFGKQIMGLRVTNVAGERIGFGHATGRYFGKMVTGLVPFAIGFIMAGFTERKQALHDMIAGTLVVKN